MEIITVILIRMVFIIKFQKECNKLNNFVICIKNKLKKIKSNEFCKRWLSVLNYEYMDAGNDLEIGIYWK